jgi:hypothetical protein
MSELEKAVSYLKAGEWQRAHAIVQEDESALGNWAHGIVHMLEGDMDNARYWYRRAGRPLQAGARPDDEIAALDRTLKEKQP